MEKQLKLQRELPVQWAMCNVFLIICYLIWEAFLSSHFKFHPIWFYQTMNVLIPSELIGWGPNWQVLVHPSSSSSQFYSKAWNTGTQAWANMENKRGELGRKNFMSHLESTNDKSLPGWQHWIVHDLNAVYKQWFKDDSSTLAEHSYQEVVTCSVTGYKASLMQGRL